MKFSKIIVVDAYFKLLNRNFVYNKLFPAI